MAAPRTDERLNTRFAVFAQEVADLGAVTLDDWSIEPVTTQGSGFTDIIRIHFTHNGTRCTWACLVTGRDNAHEWLAERMPRIKNMSPEREAPPGPIQ